MNRKAKQKVSDCCAALLMLLFVYAGASKLLGYGRFVQQMGLSPFIPNSTVKAMGVIVPATEVLISILLMTKTYRLLGFYCSLFLMTLFTVYIFLLLNNDYYIPCSCGGILGHMPWLAHIWFNIFFVFVAVCGIVSFSNESTKKVIT